MSGDKRSVVTDALETLGTVPIPADSGRDAIHLAVEPVIASERLLAGQDVYLLPDGRAAKGKENAVGIVDPFLKRSVQVGEKFWLVVYPRQITSLRHVWTHPAFEEKAIPDPLPEITEEEKDRARIIAGRLMGKGEQWLRDFCAQSDCPSYESIMEAIKNGGTSMETDEYGDSYGVRIDKNYIHVNGSDAHGDIPPEFWEHVEVVTGKKQVDRPTYFNCSC